MAGKARKKVQKEQDKSTSKNNRAAAYDDMGSAFPIKMKEPKQQAAVAQNLWLDLQPLSPNLKLKNKKMRNKNIKRIKNQTLTVFFSLVFIEMQELSLNNNKKCNISKKKD